MKKKLLTHIVFFLILEIIYIIFNTIYYTLCSIKYSEETEFLSSLVWNLILTSILFCINLIENRRYKWIPIVFVCILHLVLTILGAAGQPLDGDMIDLLWSVVPMNIPFLPRFQLGFESRLLNKAIYYVIFFYGPLLYWYFAYQVSKKIVSKFRTEQ